MGKSPLLSEEVGVGRGGSGTTKELEAAAAELKENVWWRETGEQTEDEGSHLARQAPRPIDVEWELEGSARTDS